VRNEKIKYTKEKMKIIMSSTRRRKKKNIGTLLQYNTLHAPSKLCLGKCHATVS